MHDLMMDFAVINLYNENYLADHWWTYVATQKGGSGLLCHAGQTGLCPSHDDGNKGCGHRATWCGVAIRII